MEDREVLQKLWWAGVNRVRGDVAVKNALAGKDCDGFTHILAAGKAAVPMARAGLASCDNIQHCLILTKYDHDQAWTAQDRRVAVIEAGHPVPDERSLEAGEAAIDFVSGLGANDQLLLLVSGGASAIVEALPVGLDLATYQSLTRSMLAEGLDIHAINAKRKKISLVKDGKLLARFTGNRALSLAISDVEGDDIGVIASGLGKVPEARSHENLDTEIIASNYVARIGCEELAEEEDLEVIVNSETLYEDVFVLARQIADIVNQGAPGLYIFGGEPTILLPPNPGQGGRNQALAVALARELSGGQRVSALVAGTDGTDGPTNAAGGFVTAGDWQRFEGGEEALSKADSGSWLEKSGGLFIPGPTGTNVMDLCLVLKY